LRKPFFDPDELSSNPFAFVAMIALVFCSSFVVLLCANRIATVFFSADDFVVSTYYKSCEKPLNNRCDTHYSIIRQDGSVDDFLPFGYQFKHGSLVEGTHIVKGAQSFTYVINDDSERWPYLGAHVLALIAGICGVVVWFVLIRMGILPLWFKHEEE
jgi:hypothetical protein